MVGISCGSDYTCAWKSNGTVLCWGVNDMGQLGSATTSTVSGTPGSSVPVAVSSFRPAGTTVTSLAAGVAHTCALLSDGSVWCWGSDQSQQLGTVPTTSVNGNAMSTTTPLRVSGVSAPGGALGTANSATFVVSSTGAVTAWGSGTLGELANGSEMNSATPIAISGISATAITSTGMTAQACVLGASGAATCWGSDFFGELGNGMFGSFVSTPVAVPNAAGSGTHATSVAVGGGHICIAYSNGTVWCAGRNDAGQLGATTTGMVGAPSNILAGSATPVRAGLSTQVITALAAVGEHTCALLGTGAVMCWGWALGGVLGNTAPGNFTIDPVMVTGW
jgi:alpha-tubulin suppressor-like RCC1 family protein